MYPKCERCRQIFLPPKKAALLGPGYISLKDCPDCGKQTFSARVDGRMSINRRSANELREQANTATSRSLRLELIAMAVRVLAEEEYAEDVSYI